MSTVVWSQCWWWSVDSKCWTSWGSCCNYLQVLAGRSTAVCISDGCLLPLLLAKAAGVQLYSIESSPHSSSIVKEVGQL